MTLNQIFVVNLTRIMQERNLTKKSVYLPAKLSNTHLDGILEGTHGLTLRTVERLCTALGVDAGAMMEE